MPSRTPRSYDEIVRRTVVDPDSSWRPTPEQERETARAPERDDHALYERVWQALVDTGLDLECVGIEVHDNRVTVRGQVHNAFALGKIPAVIERVDGVEEVRDFLVIGTPRKS
jgi:osmotically-inducible protein OsmY